jgi:hypothetical protein
MMGMVKGRNMQSSWNKSQDNAVASRWIYRDTVEEKDTFKVIKTVSAVHTQFA